MFMREGARERELGREGERERERERERKREQLEQSQSRCTVKPLAVLWSCSHLIISATKL